MSQLINHVMISVSDVKESVRFYQEALGLEIALSTQMAGEGLERMTKGPYGLSGEMVLLRGDAGIGQIELIQWDPPAEQPGSTALRVLGRPMLSFEAESVEDLYATHRKLTDLGYDVWSEPARFPIPGYGYVEAFMVADPDGTCVEFVRLPTRDEVKAFLAEAAGR